MSHPERAEQAEHQPSYLNWQAVGWLVLLGFLIVAVFVEPHTVEVRVLGVSAILVFSAVYTHAFAYERSWLAVPEGASVAQELRMVAPPLLAMTVCALVSLPAVGWWWVCYTPYFAAYILFLTRLRTGLVAAGLVTAAALVTIYLGHPGQPFLGAGMGTCLSCGGIALGRLAAESDARTAAAARERAATAQERATARTRDEISRDIHDLLGHSLTVLTLKAEVARRLLDTQPQRAARELDEIIVLARASLADVRSTVTRLRAPDLAGQVEATRTALSAAAVSLSLHGSAQEVPERQRPLLSWALREATTNVVRHAGASHVEVEIAPGLLRVSDDGVGLGPAGKDVGEHRVGNGLIGLRSRIEAEGGSLILTSPAPVGAARAVGTVLEVRLP